MKKPWIVPIPGTRKLARLEENVGAASIDLTAEDLRDIEEAFSKITVQGARLSEDHMKLIDRRSVETGVRARANAQVNAAIFDEPRDALIAGQRSTLRRGGPKRCPPVLSRSKQR